MVKSMTAYARQEDKHPWGSIVIELRSVNHRFLDVSIKIPEELRSLEIKLRNRIKKQVQRGKLDMLIYVNKVSASTTIAFNRELAEQVAKTLRDIDKIIYNAAPVNAMDIINWPGVMATQSLELNEINDPLFLVLDQALNDFIGGKIREGEALGQMIVQRSDALRTLIHSLREQMPELIQLQKNRLEDKLQSLKADMDNDRLEQEMVYLAQKADVAEELDRLDTHLDEINRAMQGEGTIGRRLDFLMQELNREANTLGSKSIAANMTQISVDMKVLIEQMREQVQNIE